MPARQSACSSTRTCSAFCSRLRGGGFLLLADARQNAELVLHVVPDLVRDHVGFGELAGIVVVTAAEFSLQVLKKRGVQIDALIGRAVERAHGRARQAAAALLGAAEQAKLRRMIGAAAGREDFFPSVFGARRALRRRICRSASFGVPVEAGGAEPLCCVVLSPVRICAPLSSTLGSMPKYQLIRPTMTMVPMPRPPAPPGMPPASAPRSSSTLSLGRKSSVRIAHSPSQIHRSMRPAISVANHRLVESQNSLKAASLLENRRCSPIAF